MALQSRARYQGLFVPLVPAGGLSAAGAGQAGARPGPAIASQATGLRWVGSGTQEAESSYDLRTQRAGYPTGLSSGLGMLMRPTLASLWRGWDEPATVTGWEAVVAAEVGDPFEPRWPSVCPLSCNKLLLLYGGEDSAEEVWSKVWSPSTGTWSTAVRIYAHPTLYASGWEAHPQAIQLPSGRILVHWLVQRVSGVQVSMAYSDDDGASWVLAARDVLPAALVANTAAAAAAGYQSSHGLAVAYHRLGVALFISVRLADTAGAEQTILIQYASDSLGSSYTEVGRSNSDALVAAPAYEIASRPTVIAINGGLLLIAGSLDPTLGSKTSAHCRFLGDPWMDWTTAEAIEIAIDTGDQSSYNSSDADLTGSLSSHGAVYVVARGSDNIVRVHRSQDAGATWESLARGGITADCVGNHYPHRLNAGWYQERLILAHQGDAAVGLTEPTVAIATLGGWSTVPRADGTSAYNPGKLAALPQTWIPYGLPTAAGWTGAGLGTVTLTPSGLRLECPGAPRTYLIDPGGTLAQGITLEVEVTPSTGGTSSDQVYLSVRVADGVDEFSVGIRVGTAGILVRDEISTGTIGTVTADTTGGVCILVDMATDAVRVYWRPRMLASDRAFALVASSDTLVSDFGTPAATPQILWGGGIGSQAVWHRVSYGSGTQTGEHLLHRSAPRDLPCLHPARAPVYIDKGLWVAPHDGPAYAADEWQIQTAYDYGATLIDPSTSPSPRRRWRSTDTTAINEMVWSLDPGGVRIPCGLLGILSVGANWRTANLRRTDGAGAISTLATIDAAAGMTGLAYVRSGTTVVPGGAASGTIYLQHGEAIGWSIDFGGGVVRRVVAATEGRWGGTGRQAVLTIADATGVSASGNLALVPDTWLAVVSVPLIQAWRAIGLQIAVQSTADGYFESGILWPGSVEMFGFIPSWGAGSVEYAGAIEEYVSRDGIQKRIERAPMQRVLTASWVDGIDTGRVSPGSVDPDHLQPWTGGRDSATVQSAPHHLAGLLRELQGGATPCAWVRRFDQATGAVAIVNRRQALIYGHLEGQISHDHIQGDPEHDEVLRGGTVAIRELV